MEILREKVHLRSFAYLTRDRSGYQEEFLLRLARGHAVRAGDG
jgi:hypothetical protein